MEAEVNRAGGREVGLWPHQREAIDLTVKQLAVGGRGQLVLACGTGKTRIGMHAAQSLAPAGRVLVCAPTVMLLAQTMHVYRAELGDAALGRLLLVCGDAQATAGGRAAREELADQLVEVTTSPHRIGEVTGEAGRVTVMATYASLAAVARAHREYAAPSWDVVVADEAHRTAGGGSWSLLHDDHRIPARRRLYMTATPRIVGASAGGGDGVMMGMDDEQIWGPVLYQLGLPSAVELGLLAQWRLVVAAVTSAQIRELAAEEESLLQVGRAAIPARMLACQIALLRAAHTYGLRAAITYHSRVSAARAFAATLPAAVGLLPKGERPRLRWAGAAHGAHSATQRHLALGHLADGGEGLAVLANARLLTEGVDVPAVDAVLFADPRRAVVDVVQAIGRALRRGDRPGKIATVIVPLLLDDEEATDAMLKKAGHATLNEVIRALRAHDERLVGELREYRRRHERPNPAADDDRENDVMEVWRPHWLEVTGADLPPGFASAVTVRLAEAGTTSWERGLAAVTAFRDTHGHLSIPQSYVTPSGFRAGAWLNDQRRAHAADRLTAEQAAMLEAQDIDWAPHDTGWQRFLNHLTAFRDLEGHARVPHDYVSPDGYRLGSIAVRKRQEIKQGTLSAARAAQVKALGMETDPHETAWEHWYRLAKQYFDTNGDLFVPRDYLTPGEDRLGNWIHTQRHQEADGSLTEDRRRRLLAIGMIFDVLEHRWQEGFAALRDFHDTHHHLRIPTGHTTSSGVKLYSWWRTQYRLAHRLTPERRALLARYDPAFATPPAELAGEDNPPPSATAQAPTTADGDLK